MWNCPYSHDSFPIYAEDIDAGGEASPSTAMLAEVSRTKKVTIVAGSIPERSGGRLYNTCCVFGKDGDLIAKFRKVLTTPTNTKRLPSQPFADMVRSCGCQIHLFDIDIPGKITFKESDTLTPGEELCVVDTGEFVVDGFLVFLAQVHQVAHPICVADVGRIAVGICYDIRFPELAMLYAARGNFPIPRIRFLMVILFADVRDLLGCLDVKVHILFAIQERST